MYIFFLCAFSDHSASANGSPIKTQDHVKSKQNNNSLRPEDAALRRLHANIQDMKDIQGPAVTLRSGRGPWNHEQKYKRHSSYVSRDHSREANPLVTKIVCSLFDNLTSGDHREKNNLHEATQTDENISTKWFLINFGEKG
jgi:hypothetical protein